MQVHSSATRTGVADQRRSRDDVANDLLKAPKTRAGAMAIPSDKLECDPCAGKAAFEEAAKERGNSRCVERLKDATVRKGPQLVRLKVAFSERGVNTREIAFAKGSVQRQRN